MSECAGKFGRFFGHRFRARYSESRTFPKDALSIQTTGCDPYETRKTYVRDVCTRCGANASEAIP